MNRLYLFGDINVNCFFIEHNNKCYIVDPGYEKERVIEYVKNKDWEVLGILLTHAHIDHIGAIDAFDVPVYVHKNDYKILFDESLNGFEYFGKKPPYNLNTINVIKIEGGDLIKLDDKNIEVIHTPGHTVGSVCYKIDDDMYTGDTLFEGTVGKWTFPSGNLKQLQKSVVDLIESQSKDIKIHPAHGASSTIGTEKRFNYFYNMWKSIEN